MATVKFESGNIYERHGVSYKVVKRSKYFATLESSTGETMRKAIREWEDDTELINLAEWPELDYLFAKNGGEYRSKEQPATESETSQPVVNASTSEPVQIAPAKPKDRRKLNALMRKLDDFEKQTALKIYREGRNYESKVLEGFDGVTERDRIEAYLLETWTFDELYDLCRCLNVKPKGYRDFSFDFDCELIDPILDIIMMVGAYLDANSASTSQPEQLASAETAEFELALERVKDGQCLPYHEYSREELMRLACAKGLEVLTGISREELEEAIIRAIAMSPEEGSYLWAVIRLECASDGETIRQILSDCSRSVIEQINASEWLGFEAEKYPCDDDLRLAVQSRLSDILDDVQHGEPVEEYGGIVAEWVEMAEMRRNYEIAKKIESYVNSLIHEPAHCTEPYALFADEEYSDDGGDNSRPEQDILDNHTQEEQTVSNLTAKAGGLLKALAD